MSGPRAAADALWTYNGLQAVVMENPHLRLVVLPEAGGKLFSLQDRRAAREWLWQNPRIKPERAMIGGTFDNHWSGGADAFFPTCYPCSVDGLAIPDSGEWWSIPWTQQVTEDDAYLTLTLTAGGRVYPTRSERTFRLGHDSRSVCLGFAVENVGHESFPFLLGFHPALQLRPGGRIHLLPGTACVDETSGGSMGTAGQTYRWPDLPLPDGGAADMSVVRPATAGQYGGHFHFPDGGRVAWAVTDPGGGPGLALSASPEFTGLWIWQVYGGWLGYHHVALEPWTGYPITLSQAVAAGGARQLAPGETFRAEVTLACLDGAAEVARILGAGAHAAGGADI